MVISRAASAAGVFEPEDLGILQRIFDQACKARGYARDSAEAGALAAEIVSLFGNGIVNEGALYTELGLNAAKEKASQRR